MPVSPPKHAFVNAVALVALVVAFYYQTENRNLRHQAEIARQEQQAMKSKLAGLEDRLASADNRRQAAENALAKTKASAISPTPRPTSAEDSPVTAASVEARYDKARKLARTGSPAEALAEFLWCYDEGMVRVTSYTGVRQSFLLSEIAQLAKTYPPALQALKDRRDGFERRLLNGEDDFDAAMSFSSLNRVLGESERTLAHYDRLGEDSPAKRTFAIMAYDQLADARRYREAAQAKPFRQMLSFFEDMAEQPKAMASNPGAGPIIAEQRRHASRLGAGFVEVLAGAGQLDNARDLAEIVMAYDQSPETKAILQNAAAKAGQPGLLERPSPR